MRAAVVVLSDLGRNPRMQRHARAWAMLADVDLIGLHGSALEPGIDGTPRLAVHRLRDGRMQARSRASVSRFVVASALRAAAHALSAFRALMRLPRPDVILVGNPPAVPALGVCWVVSRLRGARFIIDWQDLSHRRAAAQIGESHRLVRSIARSERRWARRADAHVAASQALADWLRREYGVQAAVVYDRPMRSSAVAVPSPTVLAELGSPLAVCPTGWGADEDFDLLLEALERTDRSLSKGAPPAKLTVVLTGTGELRGAFETRLARRQFAHVAVRVLEVDSHAAIAIADIGICLHQSASGLDLPMVLSDLRGANVPACVYDYAPVLTEVLTNGREGVRFGEPGELMTLLVAAATRDSSSSSSENPLARSRAWLASNPPETWEDTWPTAMAAVIGVGPG
ncbi:MAG: glycosyltransferase [Vicinamibacterales bacterium]